MKKRILSLVLLLVLMLSQATQAFADTGETVTTFNDTVEITNVVKTSNPFNDKSFNKDKADKTLDVSGNDDIYDYNSALYYCDSAPVTITLKKATTNSQYAINSWRVFCVDEASSPSFNITKYDTLVYALEHDEYGYLELSDEKAPAQAFSGTMTITKPGTYYIYLANHYNSVGAGEVGDTGIYVVVGSASSTTAVTAKPTASEVLVDGQSTKFEAYNINGSNYFKLRDLAYAVSGSEKQFEVTWDGSKKAINLISDKDYTVVGSELVKGDGVAKAANLSTATVYVDDKEVSLTAYTIKGNTYFKLKDIAKAFNIGVTWDGATKTVGIDTTISYTE